MRLVSFRLGGDVRYGALAGKNRIVDLAATDPRLPARLVDALPHLVGYHPGSRATLDLAEVTLLPVVPDPQKIICIGVNYADHIAETNSESPPYPTVFAKFSNALIAHGDPIVLPSASTMPDYEGELAVVIGRTGKHISEDDALHHVAGYSALNDISARDFQEHTSQWIMGKTPDTFAPIGRELVTADEVPEPQKLTLRTTVSGEVLQEARTGDMIFGVRRLIAYLSSTMTLQPGDIIATGTPSGVGVARNPQRFLRDGDVVTVTVDGVTELTNPVVSEA